MTSDAVTLILTRPTFLAVCSAANEATIFDEDDRQRTGSPAETVSDTISETLSELLKPRLGQDGPFEWTVPREWLPAIKNLIPACLLVHDDEELQLRTMETRADFETAQTELIDALGPHTA